MIKLNEIRKKNRETEKLNQISGDHMLVIKGLKRLDIVEKVCVLIEEQLDAELRGGNSQRIIV